MFTGKLLSLKRFKDDVKEVQSGYECGIGIDGYNDIKEGDIFEFFIEEKENNPSMIRIHGCRRFKHRNIFT